MTATRHRHVRRRPPTRPAPRARVGVFGIGLDAYWPQFEGLRERIEGYQRRVEERVARRSAARSSPPGSSTPRRGAREAGDRFAAAQVDLVLCHAVTYATSSQVLPAVQAAKVPVVLLGLQPTATLDYEHIDTGEWLANCAACCVPELAGAFTRARIPYDTVAGTIDDDERAWAKIARLGARGGRGARAAPRRGSASSATPIRACSTCTPTSPPSTRSSARTSRCSRSTTSARASRAATDAEVAAKEAEIRAMFDFADPSGGSDRRADRADEQLDWSARVAVGLDRLAADFELDALTYYYRGRRRQRGRAPRRRRDRRQLAADRARRPDRGRGRPQDQPRPADPRPARRRRLVHRVLRARLRRGLRPHGPRRPGPRRDRRRSGPTLRALKLYHGKRGAGLSVEFKVRYGPITIVGCTQTADGALKLVVAEGESIPGATFRIGNTNTACASRRRRPSSSSAGAREGPTHHVALGVGHRRRRAAARRVAARTSSTPRWAEWSASASCCGSARTGSTSTARATARSGRRCSTRCATAGWGNYSLFLRDDGLLVGYLETDDFEAAQRGDGGDRRQRPLAGARWRRSSSCRGERPDTGLGA